MVSSGRDLAGPIGGGPTGLAVPELASPRPIERGNRHFARAAAKVGAGSCLTFGLEPEDAKKLKDSFTPLSSEGLGVSPGLALQPGS